MAKPVTFVVLRASGDPMETKRHDCNVEAITDGEGKGLRIVWCSNTYWNRSIVRANDRRLLKSGFFDSIHDLLTKAEERLKVRV